ncbi:MAG: hypothetical protein PHU14_04995, partial [Methylovulum sp.]|nr:hypothetical protein [Methylovulum sp.]
YDAAYGGHTESLQIRWELKNRLGATPQILQDLSFSLEKQANCLHSLKHYEQALATYQECLPILERLQAALSYDEYSERIAKVKQDIADLEQSLNSPQPSQAGS